MLDIENLDLKLDTEFIGRNFFLIEEIDSTNSTLLTEKKTYKDSGTVLFAEKQLHGKGRMGRSWQSIKEQNLTFSILLRNNNLIRDKLSLINLASSLAIALSIENLYQLKCELKWPNDVLIKRKKVSGILIETSIAGKKIERIVVGMGINVNQNSFVGEFNIRPTSIKLELNRTISRETLLAGVLNCFEEQLEIVKEKPEHILNDWRSRCDMIGSKITIQQQDKIRSGIFEDIDQDGYLILGSNGKTEKIYFGDISLI
ncbi:MAG TPA: biotin--[acetyl-CoA-carboxylase] ligase [Ignavibacteriaceae bacterium]|nr:biotin--[acetyl-CoA-carboxylase] ligase [Ignavibacteriaceae bacterium]